VWAKIGEHLPRAKSMGRSLMVSGVICQCHGVFHFDFFEAGKNREGWWTCIDLKDQVGRQASTTTTTTPTTNPTTASTASGGDEAAIEGSDGASNNDAGAGHTTNEKDGIIATFERLHPGCQMLILFDHSQNHLARNADGLDASLMNLGKPRALRKDEVPMRNGWFVRAADGIRVEQPMMADGKVRSIREVLRERELWKEGEKLTLDAARELLEKQPDFLAQKPMIEELVIARGHLIDFIPKYHCEINAIERVWGAAKRGVRNFAPKTFVELKQSMRDNLKNLALASVKRFIDASYRYIELYRPRGNVSLPFAVVAFAQKEYKSHRRIPDGLFVKLEEEWKKSKRKHR